MIKIIFLFVMFSFIKLSPFDVFEPKDNESLNSDQLQVVENQSFNIKNWFLKLKRNCFFKKNDDLGKLLIIKRDLDSTIALKKYEHGFELFTYEPNMIMISTLNLSEMTVKREMKYFDGSDSLILYDNFGKKEIESKKTVDGCQVVLIFNDQEKIRRKESFFKNGDIEFIDFDEISHNPKLTQFYKKTFFIKYELLK